MFVVKTSNTTA